MEDPRRELIENIDKYSIDLDDVFAFKCRKCGKCCKNREDILLSPKDIYNIARQLEITPIQAFEKYCETYIGPESRIPIVRLKPLRANKVCPLLKGDKCIVHDAKPTVCALFPLGRISIQQNPGNEIKPEEKSTLKYVINPITCGSRRQKQTVRSWLEKFNIPVEDPFFFKWRKTVSVLGNYIKIYENEKISTEVLSTVWTGILMLLYFEYDTQKEFMPQFEKNTSNLLNIFIKLQQHFPIKPQNSSYND